MIFYEDIYFKISLDFIAINLHVHVHVQLIHHLKDGWYMQLSESIAVFDAIKTHFVGLKFP